MKHITLKTCILSVFIIACSSSNNRVTIEKGIINLNDVTQAFSISSYFVDPQFKKDVNEEYFIKRNDSDKYSFSFKKSIENGLIAYSTDLFSPKDTLALLSNVSFHKIDGLCDKKDNFYALAVYKSYAKANEYETIVDYYIDKFGDPLVEWDDTVFKRHQIYSWSNEGLVYKIFQPDKDEIQLYILNSKFLNEIKKVGMVWYDAFDTTENRISYPL